MNFSGAFEAIEPTCGCPHGCVVGGCYTCNLAAIMAVEVRGTGSPPFHYCDGGRRYHLCGNTLGACCGSTGPWGVEGTLRTRAHGCPNCEHPYVAPRAEQFDEYIRRYLEPVVIPQRLRGAFIDAPPITVARPLGTE